MSLLLEDVDELGVSLDGIDEELGDELSVVDGVAAGVIVPVSVLVREPMLPDPSWRCSSVGVAAVPPVVLWVLLSLVGSAEVDGRLLGVGAVLGLEAAFGELLLGTDGVVWAMVTPAALTRATTAAMLKVLVAFFMGLTPVP